MNSTTCEPNSPPLQAITVGAGRKNSQGRLHLIEGANVVATVKASIESMKSRDAWWSPHAWADDYRCADRWEAASAIVVDIDYDEIVEEERGGRTIVTEHKRLLPPEIGRIFLERIEAGPPINLAHSTPHGARTISILEAPATDRDQWLRATDALIEILGRVLRDAGIALGPNVGDTGLTIDIGATRDRGRLFFAPNARVDNIARLAPVHVISESPISIAELLIEQAHEPPKREEPRRRKSEASTDFAKAAERWNGDHPGGWPRSNGQCPTCGCDACFGTMPDNPARWCCFNTDHQAESGGCGVEHGTLSWGSALDLEAHARRCKPIDVLVADGYLSAEKPAPRAWDQPIPFSGDFLRPECPVDILPEALRTFVVEVSRFTQTPVEMPFAMVLCAIATLAQRGAQIEIVDGYTEELCLYIMLAMRSGERKSAVVSHCIKPLALLERDLADGARDGVRNAKAQRDALKKVADKLLRGLKPDDPDARAAYAEAHRAHEEATIPTVPRYLADDVTPESLVHALSEQGSLAILQPEPGVLGLFVGRYADNAGPNVEIFLKGHVGERHHAERVGRPPDIVDNPRITIGIAGQPDAIFSFVRNRMLRDRGLVARVAVIVPSTRVGSRDCDPNPIEPAVLAGYADALRKIHDAMPAAKRTLRFTREARDAVTAFRRELEPRLAADLESAADWVGKAAGLAARIAGLLHVAEHGFEGEVNAEHASSGARVARWMLIHQLHAFDSAGAEPATGDARRILAWIERERVQRFSRRDAQRAVRALASAKEAAAAIVVLVDRGFARAVGDRRNGQALDALDFETNPAIFARSES
jgi:replicative DNA helicase